ncbi:cytochrome P450 4B1-like [Dysidea avara]|uniref:cytochrome P450 4B1-like n=1 Tax=Dysidea avara TaxID=196820 RepID=UPI00331D1A2B
MILLIATGWTIYCIVCLLTIWICYKSYPSVVLFSRQWYYLRCLPRLPTHWLWGHLHIIDGSEKMMLHFLNYYATNDIKLSAIWFGPFIAAAHCYRPETIKIVLKERKAHRLYRMIIPWIGTGLLVANDEKWFRSRRLLTPAFHFGVLKPYVQVYNECVQTLIEKWAKLASSTESVEICDSVSLLTLDVILRCAFSYKSDCQDLGKQSPYVTSVCALSRLLVQRLLYIPHQSDFLFYLSPSGREFRRACKIVHDHSDKVVRDRKTVLEEQIKKGEPLQPTGGRKYLDFLDILLTSKDEDGVGLTDEEIRAEVDTFMFEGHDTTAAGIFWTLYCLAKYPDHQEKCREEIRTVLDGRESFEWEDLKSLSYTTMCIKEAMRLYPPVPHYFRDLSEDTIIHGHLIPKGTFVIIGALEVHRQPDVWENPEEYDPLRFLPERSEGRDNFAYMPFSAGPRNCIGQNFALNEERVVIGKILHKFSLQLDDNHVVEMVPQVILRAKYGVKLKFNLLADNCTE